MTRPLCFVLMPFGTKPDAIGRQINFDSVYEELIRPAIVESDLEAIRADEEQVGGIIHKPMFERLLLCEYAVADLTTANPNVFYELGVRHAVRPFTTVLIFSAESRLPFDVAPLRALPYALGGDGRPSQAQQDCGKLFQRLVEARTACKDSPLFQLIEGYQAPDIQHIKTDVFRQQVQYCQQVKERLAAARRQGQRAQAELQALQVELEPLERQEAGVLVDLFLSYRAVKAWQSMIALFKQMAPELAATVLVREQFAFALNRTGQSKQAEQVLQELIAQRGPSSETYGLLGRVYKDRWESALQVGDTFEAEGWLERAIDAYLKGFEADWRDAYPGVNAVTLMELHDPPDERATALAPVVAYAVERRIARGKPDYWDYATLLELAVLARDEKKATQALRSALALVREVWEAETTLRNLKLICSTREERGEATPTWCNRVMQALLGRQHKFETR